jgi:signal transduction histidine kinase
MENNKQLKILMLEDRADDAFLVERILSRSDIKFISERVDSREEFVRAIRDFGPDVVLSDHGLPSFNSREALKISQKELPGSPFILVTGTMSDENAIACLREGADDYILKSNLSRLPAAVLRAIKARKLERLKREARYALRKQNSELVKVNSELDSFVYAVSHNLRGPVASIIGLLNIAATPEGRNDVDSLLRLIRDRTARLDETVQEIVEYSNNARTEVTSSKIDWQKIIKGSWERLAYLPNAKLVTHRLRIASSAYEFHGDEMRLGFIFNCIYSNGIMYSDVSKNPSFVETSIEINRERAAIITISDNGVGIREEYMPSIFNMFFRANERSQGAGLGLYIARETIHKLRGSIEVTSREYEGTRVTIIVPEVPGGPAQPAQQT